MKFLNNDRSCQRKTIGSQTQSSNPAAFVKDGTSTAQPLSNIKQFVNTYGERIGL
jgi:hypothetical protein